MLTLREFDLLDGRLRGRDLRNVLAKKLVFADEQKAMQPLQMHSNVIGGQDTAKPCEYITLCVRVQSPVAAWLIS